MSVSPRLWMGTFVALVFMIGLAAGVLVDRTWLDDRPRGFSGRFWGRGPGGPNGPGGPSLRGGSGSGGPGESGRGGPGRGPFGPSPERVVADLERELELTTDQKTQVLAAIANARPKLEQIQQESRDKFLAEQRALDDAIVLALTPAQATKYKLLMELQRRGRGRR